MSSTPFTAKPSGTELAVCRDITSRQQFGIAKYGQTVADNPLELRAWLEHAYYEALDQAIYLKRAMEEIDKGNRLSFPDVPTPSNFVPL